MPPPDRHPGNGVSQRDLVDLERRMRAECHAAVKEAVAQLERVTERAIGQLAATIEDRRGSGRWWATFAVAVVGLLAAIAVGVLR